MCAWKYRNRIIVADLFTKEIETQKNGSSCYREFNKMKIQRQWSFLYCCKPKSMLANWMHESIKFWLIKCGNDPQRRYRYSFQFNLFSLSDVIKIYGKMCYNENLSLFFGLVLRNRRELTVSWTKTLTKLDWFVDLMQRPHHTDIQFYRKSVIPNEFRLTFFRYNACE